MRALNFLGVLAATATVGCGESSEESKGGGSPDASMLDNRACDAPVEVMETDGGIEFVRTPGGCFADLESFPFTLRRIEIDGLAQGYVDEGPADADPVLLLHGQPTWAYLYRKMIPVLVNAGHRVIAMDFLGMGFSDKPTSIDDYSYLGHGERLEKFIGALGLENITLFCQDWGSLIGLRVAGENPDLFARIVVGDGTLPVVPEGVMPFPVVQNPDVPDPDLESPFAAVPDQQPNFYLEDGGLAFPMGEGGFARWMEYSMRATSFHPAEVIEALTYFPIPEEVEAAYDAPFPTRDYMAGVRVFPSLVNQLGGKNDEAWAGLMAYQKPFLTIWASNDPGNLGRTETQDRLIDNIPGAANQPHTRLPEASHFLQDDQGEAIANRMVDFIADNPR